MTTNNINADKTILVVEDDTSLREVICDTLTMAGYPVVCAENGVAALSILKQGEGVAPIVMVLSDIRMPTMDGNTLLKRINELRANLPVLMMTAFGTVGGAVEAMQHGAVDYLVKPFDADTLLEHVARFISANKDSGMIAEDPKSRQLLELGTRVARSDSTVMITGDSGTGKEVLARHIHDQSQRADQAFVAINCAAIPENMLEATLFGYEKGAFTGAHQACPGKFEQAQGGTLLLDEITEMDLGLQAKLLRVIQEREVERLGGRKTIPLNVRILATSNRDMREAVDKGQFREDLYFRLNVFPLKLPALRERSGDILPLARNMLKSLAARSGRAIPKLLADADNALLAHSWPGNVRELGNVIERAMVLQSKDQISAADLMFEHSSGLPVDPGNMDSEPACPAPTSGLRAREQDLILQTLRDMGGQRSDTARHLGISPRTLRYKIARMRDQGIAIPA